MDSPDDKSGGTFLAVAIAVIVILILAVVLVSSYSQSQKEQAKRNLDTLLNTNPSYVQIVEAQHHAAREHYQYLLWGATNGYPDFQFAVATNALYETQQTNVAVYWLHKAAEQDYQPAKDLLLKLE